MSDAPGAHGLGPHVVGRRVVVRRLLPGRRGPSGGPAMTDVLGVCTAWGETTLVVQPESGPPVTIELAHVVSGKPVPPRPSVRHRVAPRECQVRALALWPDLRTEPLGDWLLRSSPTERARRANSVLAFGPPGVADDEAYARVVAHYDRPVAAVLPGSAEEALFRGRGWVAESHDADTVFQLAGVARLVRALRSAVPLGVGAVEVEELAPGVVRALVGEHATGLAAYADDWVGFRGLEVAPAHRGRGLALAVMAALAGWGAEQGATTAYLQVLADNAPALRLYDGLGFRPHHTYRYLAPVGA